jgi:hypothetical protein
LATILYNVAASLSVRPLPIEENAHSLLPTASAFWHHPISIGYPVYLFVGVVSLKLVVIPFAERNNLFAVEESTNKPTVFVGVGVPILKPK